MLEVVGKAHGHREAGAQGAAQNVQVLGHVHEVGLAGLAHADAGGFQQRLGQQGLQVAAAHQLMGVGTVMGADNISGPEYLHCTGADSLLTDAQMGHAKRLAGGIGLPETLIEPAAFVHVFIEFQQ